MNHPSLGRHFSFFGILAFATSVLLANRISAAEAAPSDTLCVMSYNLRYASSTGTNAWPLRRPLMRECILNCSPDLIGTQEGLYPQLRELAEDLPDYDWIGLGREGGSRGEFMAVFYRKARLDPKAFDHFWLSDTPSVIGSSSWGNKVIRMVTWVLFRDRQTNAEFYLFNTHFDHEVQPSREQSASLLRKRIEAFNTNLPIIVTGDFNAAADANKAYELLTSEKFLIDTWHAARERRGEGVGTFNGFKTLPTGGSRIDWILCRGDIEVEKSEIITFSREGRFPSDHLPVVTWLKLGASR